MRIFQNIHLYPDHVAMISAKAGKSASFKRRIEIMVKHGLNGTHLLLPMVDGRPDAFLTTTADPQIQRQWAIENNLSPDMPPYEVLVEQLKAFKPDIFYTHGPLYFPDAVRQKLPSLCSMNVCWKGPPDFTPGLTGFDLLINNFPASLPRYAAMADIKTGYLTPSFDPAMEPACFNMDRKIDVLFAGTYSRHHRRRAEIMEALCQLAGSHRLKYCLHFDKATRIAATPLGLLPGLAKYRAPKLVMQNASPPVFGDDMYREFSNAKIVVNCAIDIAGNERGNIRCFEAMGCGALLVSDEGNYPPGMKNGINMLTYNTPQNLVEVIRSILADEPERQRLALEGLKLARSTYGKQAVWDNFNKLVASATRQGH
jgi:Glycosyl transferases group 1